MNPIAFRSYKTAIREGNRVEARQWMSHIVEEYTEVVRRQARRLAKNDYDDLLQAGAMGVMRAVAQFDHHRDPELRGFRTYVLRCILESMRREVMQHRAQVRVKVLRDGIRQEVREKASQIFAREGREATADELGLSPEQWEAWTTRNRYDEYQADVSTSEGMRSGALRALEITATQANEEIIMSRLDEALAEMSSEDARIVIARVIEGLTFEEIAEEEGVTKQHAHTLFSQAIEALRKTLCKSQLIASSDFSRRI